MAWDTAKYSTAPAFPTHCSSAIKMPFSDSDKRPEFTTLKQASQLGPGLDRVGPGRVAQVASPGSRKSPK